MMIQIQNMHIYSQSFFLELLPFQPLFDVQCQFGKKQKFWEGVDSNSQITCFYCLTLQMHSKVDLHKYMGL
jgi:hypothetical protein